MTKQTEKELQCKIIMLPVNGARVFDNTALLMHDKQLFLMQKADTLTDEAMANCQHVYLVSVNSHNPELPNYTEIKFDDWCLNSYDNRPWRYRPTPCPLPYWGNPKTLQKIIATTDKTLDLPGIPQSVIEKMIEENPEQSTVEIVDNGHEDWYVPSDGGEGEPFWNEKLEVKFI